MMSTTFSSLSTSISSGVAIPRQDSLNTRSVKKIAQVRQVRPTTIPGVLLGVRLPKMSRVTATAHYF